MTQAAVNSAKVLYRLSVSREDVEKAEKLFFMTPQLQKVLTSPVVPAAKKYEIIDQVFALETTEDVLVRYMKIMCRIGNMTEMQDIFQYYYKYWDQMHHVVRADLIYAETPSKEEEAEAKKILDKNYPDSEITLTQSVDESLIGGYVVKVGYKEYDHSYEGRLRQLQRKLIGRQQILSPLFRVRSKISTGMNKAVRQVRSSGSVMELLPYTELIMQCMARS